MLMNVSYFIMCTLNKNIKRRNERERERERLMVMVYVVVHLVNHLNMKSVRTLYTFIFKQVLKNNIVHVYRQYTFKPLLCGLPSEGHIRQMVT
jgi:hypothetical protein